MINAREDRLLFIEVSGLTLFGLLMVYSASFVVAAQRGMHSYYFVRQSIYAGIGYVLLVLLMFIDYRVWLKPRVVGLLATLSVAGLGFVYAHSMVIKGARRALKIGSLPSFQPSEIAKLVVLFYLALFLEKHQYEMKKPGRWFFPCLFFLSVFVGLILIEPDLGQAVCICLDATLLFLIAGLDWKYVCVASLASVPAFYLLIWGEHFRQARFLSWLTALWDPLHAGYQIKQAAIAVGRGGIFGVGFGDSLQKFLFLPEAMGDFIYAVIGEELGFTGAIIIAAAFLGFLFLGMKISLKAPDAGGFYLGLGITLMITMQAFINISTALSMIPAKGLTMPFISQGGSSLMVSLAACGIMLNIYSQRKKDNE